MPPCQLVQSHKCLPGEADDESRLTLTEEYTGRPVNQPFTAIELVDAHPRAYVAQQT